MSDAPITEPIDPDDFPPADDEPPDTEELEDE
jgi:hypothetical protein